MIKAVVFDLDGTLLDTADDLAVIMNEMLGSFGFERVSRAKVVKSIGDGAKKFVERCIPQDKMHMLDVCFERYRQIMDAAKNENVRVFDEAPQLLDLLNQQGIKTAILSNKPQKGVDAVKDKFLSGFNFYSVYGAGDDILPKPDTAGIARAARDMNVSADELVMVGDGEADCLVAKNFNAHHIAALWGYRSREQLAGVGAKHFAQSPLQVLTILKDF